MQRILVLALAGALLGGCYDSASQSAGVPAPAPTSLAPLPASAELIAGSYVYFADAATFTGCHTGERWPVAMQDAAIELERAWLAGNYSPLQPMVVKVHGDIQVLPGMEPGTEAPQLVVYRVEQAPAELSCPAAPSLTGPRWTLTGLRDRSELNTASQTPWLKFEADGRLAGYAGCNGFQGSYSLSGQQLTLTPLAMTRRACQGNAQLEADVIRLLESTRQARLDGGELVLDDAQGQELMRFVAGQQANE